MNINRILTGAVCAITILSASGCPRRVPATPDTPSADQPATDTPPPADPAPAPGDPAPAPVTPAPVNPVPVAPVPVAPPPAPVDPAPPAPVKPDPGADKPKDDKDQNDGDDKDDKDVEPPAPTAEQIFLKTLVENSGAFNAEAAVGAVNKAIRLEADGWSRGEFETPDQYIEKMYSLTIKTFPKFNDLEVPAYAAAALKFADRTRAVYDFAYYVDLKVTSERKEWYVLRLDEKSREVVGVKEGNSDYIPVLPFSGVQQQQVRSQSEAGKVFLYTIEARDFLNQEARYLRVPQLFLFSDWQKRLEAQNVQQQRVYQQRVYQQNVARQQQYNAQRSAPVGYYPQQRY